jgi:hypothetical protein
LPSAQVCRKKRWRVWRAINEADIDARNVVELLDGIPSAFARAQHGLNQAVSGGTIFVDEF